MGKPRLIILIRHAQSEGNKNRAIHQMIPDHRVKLTEDGWRQAEEAGRRLRRLLRPDDALQIYTSPYRRTRETTEGLLRTLTARADPTDPHAAPSPFSRSKITVYEEPRLREQDFGNFQPCSAEMERMWQERADYGHFFYRIPNGESAADAYDRISGFNESLWRQFGEPDFPSVCVLVTHGLMTRVFLTKWYHWSVEYFEDLRNINHCEFIIMNRSPSSGKYILESTLRTWSDLKRQKAEQEEAQANNPSRRNTLSSFLAQTQESPHIPARKWGGCVDGCNHDRDHFPQRRPAAPSSDLSLGPAAQSQPAENESDDHALSTAADHADGTSDTRSAAAAPTAQSLPSRPALPSVPSYLDPGRDGGGTSSGANTPHERSDDENDDEYFGSLPTGANLDPTATNNINNKSRELSIVAAFRRATPQRKPTPEDIERWAQESGMGRGNHADALGDEPVPGDGEDGATGGGPRAELEKMEKEERSVRESVY